MSLTQSLTAFQEAFAQALLIGPTGDSTLAALTTQPGFAVYRNTVMKGCIDALAANYPAVLRLVGSEWFRAAAALFVQAHPPQRPMLVDYGGTSRSFCPRSNRRHRYLICQTSLGSIASGPKHMSLPTRLRFPRPR
jgi:hypothetical protein